MLMLKPILCVSYLYRKKETEPIEAGMLNACEMILVNAGVEVVALRRSCHYECESSLLLNTVVYAQHCCQRSRLSSTLETELSYRNCKDTFNFTVAVQMDGDSLRYMVVGSWLRHSAA